MRLDLFYEFAVPAGGRDEATIYADTLEEIALADRLGFGAVWVVEHHFMREYAHASAPDLILAAASQRTSRLRLGHAVVLAPHQHPVRIAERAATLDLLSGGRLELGLGRGFSPREYDVFATPPGESRDRLAAAVALLRAAPLGPLPGPGPLAGCEILPTPRQRPHPPLWLAAISPESINWAAEQGLGLLAGPFKPWFMIRRDLATYRAAYRPAPGAPLPRFAMTLGVLCLEDGAKARRLGEAAFVWHYRRLLEETRPLLERLEPDFGYYRRFRWLHAALRQTISLGLLEKLGLVVVGTPAECARRMGRLAQAGVDRLLCAVGAGALPTETVRRSLHLLATQVAPELARPTMREAG